MAKRKRLTPASPTFLEAAPETKSAFPRAPIAGVARDAASTAAAQELAQTLSDARSSGRMVVEIALDNIVLEHLVRDRVATDSDEMTTLMESLRTRGQQTPIDVEGLDDGRYGLISGWRRCQALRVLFDETGEDRFGKVLCLVRQPAQRAEAYLAMVEENEVRANLSYFERARIVAKSVAQGAFDSDRAALQTLFASASRAKRSKIGSFLSVVRALDGALRFPQALTERQGLKLSKALSEDENLARTLCDVLEAQAPTNAEAESVVLAEVLRGPKPPAPPKGELVAGSVRIQFKDGHLVLEGREVTPKLKAQLVTWLRQKI